MPILLRFIIIGWRSGLHQSAEWLYGSPTVSSISYGVGSWWAMFACIYACCCMVLLSVYFCSPWWSLPIQSNGLCRHVVVVVSQGGHVSSELCWERTLLLLGYIAPSPMHWLLLLQNNTSNHGKQTANHSSKQNSKFSSNSKEPIPKIYAGFSNQHSKPLSATVWVFFILPYSYRVQ